MRTINSENAKSYRKAMDVFLLLDTCSSYMASFTQVNNTWYGGTTYQNNYKINKPYKKQILMDFAGGGFYNDGNAEPISATELKFTHYGIPAKTVDGEVIVSFTMQNAVKFKKFTRIAYDSKGKIYRSGGSMGNDVEIDSFNNFRIAKSMFAGFPADERLYLGYISLGQCWAWDNSTILECNLNLRGVETKIESPSLQASEISAKCYGVSQYSTFGFVAKNTPIYYSAGYPGDMSDPRAFYLNAPINQSKDGVISFTGYDATTFLDKTYSGRFSDSKKTGAMRWDAMNDISAIVEEAFEGSDNVNVDVEFTTAYRSNLTSGSTIKYYIGNVDSKSLLANFCNVWNMDGFFTRYVDAGKPFFRLCAADYSESVYEMDDGSHASTNLGAEPKIIDASMISDWERTTEQAPGKLEIPFTDIKYQMEKVDERSTSKVGKYYTVGNISGNYVKWEATNKAGTLIDVIALDDIKIIDETTYKFPTVYTGTQILNGYKLQPEESDSSPATFTNMTYGIETLQLAEQTGVSKMYIDGADVELFPKAAEKLMARSPYLYSFTWRGDPRMQPYDVLTVNGVLMTVESLTLEHSEGGGLSSKVVCRGGRV